MQKRAARLILLALLLAAGLGAGYFTWDIQRSISHVLDNERDMDARLDRMMTAVAELRAAAQAYVAPGQTDEPWLARTSALLEQLRKDAADVSARARSADAASRLRALQHAMASIVSVDMRAREYLRVGQELMASDLVFSEGRAALDAMSTSVRELRGAEAKADRAEVASFQRRQAALVSGVAVLWMFGLLLLVRVPSVQIAHTIPSNASEEVAPISDAAAAAKAPFSIDLDEAASVCTSMSRMTDTSMLPALLSKAANVLDATGMILWMSAGQELFAVTAHGYDPEMLGRLGSIRHDEHNATAAAWRTGQVQTVPAGAMANGAIVAPMFGSHGCIGVLAAELRHGREADPATSAVTSIFAAQLATMVAAWPAANSVDAPPATGVDAASGRHSATA